MKNDYDRTVSLICPTCASDQFESDADLPDEEREYSCGDCGERFSHEDILSANSEKISAVVDEIGNELISDITKDFNKAFSKFGK